ncbi:MAG: class I SAM-dependent methyltransferase [Nitrospiria bacterium]
MTSKQMEDLGKPDLIKAIQGRISSQGRITFAEYMEMALYMPGLGYYTSPGEKIGGEGDYYTSPDLHPLFGEMIGRQLAQIADTSALGGSACPLDIVEMGAGQGHLCQDILDYTRREHPKFFQRLSYLIIEKSHIMIEQQKERLAPYTQEDKVRWVSGLDNTTFPQGIIGFVLSNELLDSFPVHRLVKKDGQLQEIYVTLRDGKFSEVLDVPSCPDLIRYFERLDIVLEEGQQVEVNLKALDWMRQVGRILKKGVVITVDYGYPATELYSPDRKRGTFLCYYIHRVSEDPYVRVGWQDMTAHVDFTSLARTGQEMGLEVTGFTNQEYFLIGLGITQEIEARLGQQTDRQSREQQLIAMKHLVARTGLGKVFKILIQHKGPKDLKLAGLTYRPFPPEALLSL